MLMGDDIGGCLRDTQYIKFTRNKPSGVSDSLLTLINERTLGYIYSRSYHHPALPCLRYSDGYYHP